MAISLQFKDTGFGIDDGCNATPLGQQLGKKRGHGFLSRTYNDYVLDALPFLESGGVIASMGAETYDTGLSLFQMTFSLEGYKQALQYVTLWTRAYILFITA